MTQIYWKKGLILLVAVFFAGCGRAREDRLALSGQELGSADASHVEVRANTYTENRQTDPSVAIDAHGRLLVAWGSRRQEHGTYGVFAQMFDPLGRRIGSELHVNTTVMSMQLDPAVAFGPAGNAWIVWQSDQQDGDQGGIVARRFTLDEAGHLTPDSDEILVNQTRAGHQTKPSLAVNGHGRVLVTWVCGHGDWPILRARLLNMDGAFAGPEFRLGQSDAGRESQYAVAGVRDGRFVVTWARTDSEGRPEAIYARILGPDGEPTADEWQVSGAEAGIHIEPSVDVSDDGRFVVAWLIWNGLAHSVSYRVYDSAGRAITEPLVAVQGSQWCSGAAVAVAPDGDFVVAWNEDSAEQEAELASLQSVSRRATPAEIIAQRFSSAGNPIGRPFRVNRHNEGRQALSIAASGRQAAWSTRGQLAFVWSGDTGQDDDRGVALSLFVPKDLAAPEPIVVAQAPAARDVSLEDVYPQVPPVFDPDFVPEPPEVTFPLRDGDFGFLGMQATGWTPPDPEIAVGPNHVVLVVNGEIRFRTHAGTSTFAQAIAGSSGFWGSVGATSFVFDPVALYDVHSERFIVVAAELWNEYASSAINLAVSDDSDPNGTWYKYRLDVSSYGGFLDFPNLGVDANAIYVAADFFGASANPTRANYIFVIPKAPTLTGAPASISGVRTATSPRSLGNCKNYDAAAPAQYFPGIASSSSIRLHAVTNPLGTPSLSTYSLTVPSFTYPPKATQMGTSNLADTVDWRIKNSVYRNGSLWICHTIGQNSTARVRWYQVLMRGWPTSGLLPQLAQSGTLNYGVGEHTWFPDIHVDDYGNAVLVFNRSSSTQYISIQRAIRRSSDPAGTFQAPVTLQVSTSPEEGDRWGDYSGVDEQPNQPGVFWTHAEYRTSNWRTWVGKVIIDDCNGNGVADEVDIASGTSQDCNGNAVPDECDISDGTSADCNGNGVPDECDVAGGLSPDANGNGVPDECEADVLYVDAGASGAGTGLTWNDAYVDLQDALAVGRGTGSAVQEIWVAAGTYKPDRGTGNRAASFELPGGVAVYGGFAGGETSVDQRDIGANAAILSGDIGISGAVSDNSYQVLRITDTGATAVLDGFVITAGNATGASPADLGGGLYNTGDALLRNCTFRSNRAARHGGAVSNQGGPSLTLLNCALFGNHANQRGGAVQTYQSSLAAVNCTFAYNTAGGEGGGVFMNTWDTSLANCIVWGNTAMGGVSDESAQIHVLAGTLVVGYSCVQHWSGTYGGAGNLGLDARFVDADGPDNVVGTADDNLRLLPGSGAIDAGSNAAVPVGVTTDLAGGPRFIDDPATPDVGSGVPPIVDMGVYEYTPVADFDGDLDVDLFDFAWFQACMNQPATGACAPGDLTRDGQVNELDAGPFASVLTGP